MIKTIKGLEPNSEVFVPGGLIKRSDFLINSLLIMALPIVSGCIIVFVAFEYDKQTNTDLTDLVFYNYFACCTPFVYFFFQNIFKRIRDYRGVNLNLVQKAGYITLILLPAVNSYLLLRLLFSESCKTGELDHSTNLDENLLDRDCNIEKIHKLIKMRSEGHISNAEFAKLKEDVIKKAS